MSAAVSCEVSHVRKDYWQTRNKTRPECPVVAKEVFQGFNSYLWRTFRYTNASYLGWYDIIMMKSDSLIWQHICSVYIRYMILKIASSRVAFTTNNPR